MTFVLAPEAAAELADATEFCRHQFVLAAAQNFLAAFEAKIRLIETFPGVGTPTSRCRRLYPIGRYPFSILYRVDGSLVRVSAIAHHGRGPGYWRHR